MVGKEVVTNRGVRKLSVVTKVSYMGVYICHNWPSRAFMIGLKYNFHIQNICKLSQF